MPYTRPVSGAIPLAPTCYCSMEQTQICSTRRAWHPCTYAAHPPRLGKTRPHIAYWSRDPDWGVSGLDSSLAFGHVIPDPGPCLLLSQATDSCRSPDPTSQAGYLSIPSPQTEGFLNLVPRAGSMCSHPQTWDCNFSPQARHSSVPSLQSQDSKSTPHIRDPDPSPQA